MARRCCLSFLLFLLIIIPIASYSNSGVSATIQATATVADPLGISTVSSSDIGLIGFSEDLVNCGGSPGACLMLRIPDGESVIYLLETDSGVEYQYIADRKFIPIGYLGDEGWQDLSIDPNNRLPQNYLLRKITVIYTEN